jgi:tripartite-type tricarboxylate transporter receptor subunit TctC
VIAERLHAAFKACFDDPGVTEALVQQAGIVYELTSPEAFGKFLEVEAARWARVIAENNIRAE